MEKEKPVRTFSAGQVHASVFMNLRKVDGNDKYIPSVSFQKRYQENGAWKTSTVLNSNDLPRAVLVLQDAFAYIVGKTKGTEELDEA